MIKFFNLTAVAGASWRWEGFKQQFEIQIKKMMRIMPGLIRTRLSRGNDFVGQ